MLVDDGADFDQADLVGLTLKNVTDGSSCVVAEASSDILTCAEPLTGGTANRWAPGDEYSVKAPAALKADLSYTLLSDRENTTVDSWSGALKGALSGQQQSCGPTVPGDDSTEVRGVACAVLPASTVPRRGCEVRQVPRSGRDRDHPRPRREDQRHGEPGDQGPEPGLDPARPGHPR